MTEEDRKQIDKTYGVVWLADPFPEHATVRLCKMRDGKMRWLVDCERWYFLPMDRDFTPEEVAKQHQADETLEGIFTVFVHPDSGYGPAEPCPAQIATMQRLQAKFPGSNLVIHDEHFPYIEPPPDVVY